MARVNALKASFAGGEISPRLAGRTDITKYKSGATTIENMIVLSHGGARKRSGTRFVVEQKSVTDDVILIPFQYNTEQSYMLLFGPNYIWFMKDQGVITFAATSITGITAANPAVVTAPGHALSNGDRVIIQSVSGMVELNNRQFVVANATASTFELSGVDSSAYTAYSSGGSVGKIVELTTTYTADEIAEIQVCQTNDTLFIAHQNHPLRKLTRSSHTAWTLATISLTTGPFRSINPDTTITVSISGASGSTGYGTLPVGTTFTMTCTGSIFDADQVGGLFRLNEEGGGTGIQNAPVGDSTASISVNQQYTNEGNIYGIFAVSGATNWSSFTRVPDHEAGTVRVNGKSGHYFDSDFLHPGYCVVRITGYTSPTQVSAEVVRYQMPSSIVTSGTSFWEEGAWSDYRGYPSSVALYENRLFLAGSLSEPATIWSSRSGAYEDFTDGAEDDDALVYRIASGMADTIRWLMSGRVLTAGTSSGEYAIAASSQNEALTPSNFKVSPQTSFGTSSALPIRLDQAILYPQRNGIPQNASVRLREFAYSFQDDAYNSTDISIFAEHIFGPGYTRLAYLLQPNALIYASRTDGVIAACTYERAQEVVAWHRHVLGGTDAEVKTLGAIPGANGDELWMSVRRRIGEATTLVTEADAEIITEGGDGIILDTAVSPTVRYIEIMQQQFDDDDDKEDAFFVDSGLTYSGDSTTTISGLYHLRSTAVTILNNGSVETGTVSATGTLTLPTATTKCHIGLPFTAILETEDLEAGAQAGTAQARAKRVSQVWLRVINSLGGTYGTTSANQKAILYRTPTMEHGSSPDLFTGFKELDVPSGWDRKAVLRFEHSDPLPFHVLGVVAEMSVTG